MNKLIIIGNLTRDPETRTVDTQNGPVNVTSFGVAVNEKRGQNTTATFFNVTAWRGTGDNCAKWLRKGSKVCVIGKVSARTYQAQDGTTRVTMEVNAEEVEFLSSRQDTADSGAQAQNAAYPNMPEETGYTPVETDELPF